MLFTTGLQNPLAKELITDDFVCSTSNSLGAVLKHVVVHESKGETYHAKTSLETGGKPVEINCSPLDAFLAAIRAEVPIFITEEVLKKSGFNT